MGTSDDLETLVEHVDDGALTPEIEETYALAETNVSFVAMQDREMVGELVITP